MTNSNNGGVLMIKVYVDAIPKEAEECPFFGVKNKKCRIDDGKCCLTSKPTCDHLITLFIGDEEDGLGNQDATEEDS